MIRWLEKKTRITLHDVFSGATSLSITAVLQSIATVGVSIAFANWMTPADYGTYKYVWAILSLLSLAALPGIRTAVTRAIARGHEGVFRDSLVFTLKTSTLGSIGAVVIGTYYLWQGADTLGFAFLFASPFLIFFDASFLYLSYWYGRRNFATAGILTTTRILASATATLIGLRFGLSIPVLIGILLATESVCRGIFLWYTLKQIPLDTSSEQGIKSYGIHLTVAKSITNIAGVLENIFLFQFTGAVSLAVYTFALAPLEQLRSLQANIATAIFPRFSHKDWSIPPFEALIRKLLHPTLLAGLMTVVYITCIPFLFRMIFPEYIDAIIYSQILALGMVPTFLSAIANNIAQAKRMVPEIYSRIVYNLATTVIVVPILVINYGLIGLVVGVIIRKYILCYFDIALLYSAHRLRIPEQFLPKESMPEDSLST